MKNYKKVVLALLIVVLIGVMSINVFAASIYSRQKKNIYLVMDDSGSMGTSGTNDASYSVQTLIAMTDKNDSVKIYFMNATNAIGEIDMTKKSNALIADVKSKYPKDNGGTPYQPVKIAKNEIESTASMGDETEYWLVIFTDGDFDEVKNNTLDVNADLQEFAQKTLANGSKPNVLFITNRGTSPVSSNGIPNLHVVQNSSIIDSMNEAARVISGRAVVSKPEFTQNNTVVDFDIPYPTKNIIVFTQDNKVNILDVSTESPLNTSENYTVSHPGASSGNIKDSTVCFITEENGSSIRQGHFSIKFDKSLYPKDTTILYEPAIGIIATYYNQDGQQIDPQNLSIGETAKVTFTLCDSETNQPLPESMFGGAVKYSSEINGKTYTSNEVDFNVDSDTLNIKMNATLPDGYIMSLHSEYSGFTELRTINFSLSNSGKFVADYDKLKNAEGIVANILLNGDRPTAEQLKDFTLKIKGENIISSNFDIEKDEANGTFIIHPRKGLVGALTPENKTYEVVLVDKKGGEYTATLSVEIPGARPWLSLLIFALSILLVIYLIWVFASKSYFPRGKCLKLYRNSRPIEGANVRYTRYTFGKLYWNEFIMVFHGKFAFFKHLLIQLLPNQRQCVTLYGIGSPKEGKFEDITIYAEDSQTLSIADTTLSPGKYGGYTSAYVMYETDAKSKLSLDYMITEVGEKMKEYSLSLDRILSKSVKREGGASVYFLKFTTKNRR